MTLVVMYLSAIVAANLLVAQFGPGISVLNAFLFVGFDLSTRDMLHDQWRGRNLWPRMLLLVTAGSLISAAINWNAANIAIASFVAFLLSGIADALVYRALDRRSRLQRMNGSNLVSAAVDSVAFPALAFGFPLLLSVMIGQFIAKVGGGFVWSLLLKWHEGYTTRRMGADAPGGGGRYEIRGDC